MPGLKTGVENDMVWSEIWPGFGEQGGTPPPRILRSTPRVPSEGKGKRDAQTKIKNLKSEAIFETITTEGIA